MQIRTQRGVPTTHNQQGVLGADVLVEEAREFGVFAIPVWRNHTKSKLLKGLTFPSFTLTIRRDPPSAWRRRRPNTADSKTRRWTLVTTPSPFEIIVNLPSLNSSSVDK